jgi:hypothetical protein
MAEQDGGLRAGRQGRRRGAPFDRVGVHDGVVLLGSLQLGGAAEDRGAAKREGEEGRTGRTSFHDMNPFRLHRKSEVNDASASGDDDFEPPPGTTTVSSPERVKSWTDLAACHAEPS